MTSSRQNTSEPLKNKMFPRQVAPVHRPNPLKHKTLFQAHEGVDFENRVKKMCVIEVANPDDPTRSRPIYKKVYIASGQRLIGARVNLMNGANYNDPAPFDVPTYNQLKLS